MNEEQSQENKPEKQHTKQYDWLTQYQFQKGQSGNPGGAPKGKRLKTFAAEILQSMDDDAKARFLRNIEPKIIWEMAEGKAKQDVDISGHLNISQVLDELDGSKTEGQTVENQPLIQDQKQEG